MLAASSTSELLNAHASLKEKVLNARKEHQKILSRFPSPPPAFAGIPQQIDFEEEMEAPSERLENESMQDSAESGGRVLRDDLPPEKRERALRYQNYSPEEETIRNDYSQRYVDGGEWPQNWVLGAEPERRFEEYPKQQRLLRLKQQQVAAHAHEPCYLPLSLISTLIPSKFDVILVDPPFSSTFTWDTLLDTDQFPIPLLAAEPSFIFLWVGRGAGDGLERGRYALGKWGYRRCEDVVWIKTNKTSNAGSGTDPPTTSLFTRTKQHCLIGIKGTVRRSTDSWFVHCNVDTDVMIWEGDPTDPTRKPPETYTLIENFCLGLRRLELFGKLTPTTSSPTKSREGRDLQSHSFRPGWVTVLMDEIPDEDIEMDVELPVPTNQSDVIYDNDGMQIGFPNSSRAKVRRWNKEWWEDAVRGEGGGSVVPNTPEIEALRPKSPNRGQSTNRHSQQFGAPPPAGFAMGGIMGDMQVGMGVGMGMGMNPPMGMGSPFPPVVGGGMNINMRMNTPSFTSLRPTPSRAMGGQGQMTPYHLNPPPRFQQPQPSPPHFNQPSMTPSFNAADGFMPPQPWGHASPMAMPGGGGMFPMGNIGANPGIAMGMGAMGPFGGGGGNLNMGMNQPGPMTGGPMSMGMNMGAGMPAGGPGSLFAGGAPMGVNPLGMGMGIMDPNSGMGLNMPMNMGMNIPLGMNTMPIALSPNRVPGSAHPRHQPFGGVTGGMQHQQPQQQQQQQHQYRTPNQGPTGTAMRRGGQQGTHMGPGMAMRDETMMTATPMQQTTYPFHMSGHHSHSGGASGSGE